jgi:hypothetical protein
LYAIEYDIGVRIAFTTMGQYAFAGIVRVFELIVAVHHVGCVVILQLLNVYQALVGCVNVFV